MRQCAALSSAAVSPMEKCRQIAGSNFQVKPVSPSAACDLFQGVPRHPIQQEEIFTMLRRHQPEAGQRRRQAGIDIMRPRLVIGPGSPPRVGGLIGRIDDHDAAQPRAIFRRRSHGDEAAKGMRHDHGRLGRIEHAGIFQHRQFFRREQIHGIAGGLAMRRAPCAVAHARQIHRRDMIVARQKRRDEAPPIGMRGIAMHQQHAGLGRIAPAQIMDARALDRDETAFRRLGYGIGKPARGGRRRARQSGQLALIGLQIEQAFFGFGWKAGNRRQRSAYRTSASFPVFRGIQLFLSIAATVPDKDRLKRHIYPYAQNALVPIPEQLDYGADNSCRG